MRSVTTFLAFVVVILAAAVAVPQPPSILPSRPPSIPRRFDAPPALTDPNPPPVKNETVAALTLQEGVSLMADDLRKLTLAADPAVRPSKIRYLFSGNMVRLRDRRWLLATVSKLLNSFNLKTQKIVLPAGIPSNANPAIIRVNFGDYSVDPQAWDRLAVTGSGPQPLPDPYIQDTVERTVDTEDVYETRMVEKQVEKQEYYYNGISSRPIYRTVIVTEKVPEKVKVSSGKKGKNSETRPSEWVTLDGGVAYDYLAKTTGSKTPVLRSDWFLSNASVAPAYYDFIGIKGQFKDGKLVDGEKQLDELAGIDFERAKRSLIAAISDTKTVTLHNRILLRRVTATEAQGGKHWTSIDTDSGLDKEDYLDQVDTFDTPVFKAKEIIFSNPNGLQSYGLADNKKALLDRAAVAIAQHGDKMPTRLQDKQVFAGLRSCMLCHYTGLVQIRDKVRELSKGKIRLFIADNIGEARKDFDTLDRIEGAFGYDLDLIVRFDNAKYTAAVRAATGMEPLAVRDAFESLLFEYLDAFVTPEVAAAEAGMTTDVWLQTMRAAPPRLDKKRLSPHVTALLQEPPAQVSRLDWEAKGFRSMMTYLMTLPRK